MQFPPELRTNVVFIAIFDDKESQFIQVGTAFLLSVVNGNKLFVYLITCKHVVKPFLDNSMPLYVRANRSDKREVGHERLLDDWVFHDDDSVDLAVMPWVKMRQTPKPYFMGILPVNDILLTRELLEKIGHVFREGDEVVFVGLFAKYAGNTWNMPIVRFGRLALITDEKTKGEYGLTDQLFIECQAYPGNSGSPLYIGLYYNNQPTLFLMGVVTGFFPEQQIHAVGVNRVEIYTHFGISTATPAPKILQILNKEELMKAREQEIGAVRNENAPKPAMNSIPDDDKTISKEDFLNALRKVSRPDQPQPEEEKSETSE